jgi:hypothetical protein
MAGTTDARRRNALRPFIWGGAALLLSLPAIAMSFFKDAGVNWTALDFVVMGVLLLVACSAYELGTRVSASWTYRAGFGLAVFTGFLLTWANLAVGLINDEREDANLLFFGVLAIAMAGALFARFEAKGMARAMAATAVAQLLCAGLGAYLESAWVGFLISVFAAMWLGSALLFAKDAQRSAQAPVRA